MEEEKSQIESFVERVLSKADVAKVQGEAICSFNEVFFATPRGRYELEVRCVLMSCDLLLTPCAW